MKKPLISVIMPVKNAGRFIVAAVDSIRNQTYTNWEMIVVDDGSKDNTATILKKFSKLDKRIQVITNKESKGIGASLNIALRLATGEYIARMDGDDISLPHRFATQLEYFKTSTKLVALGGQAEMIDGDGKIFAYKNFPTDSKILREMIMWVVPMQHPIIMVKAKVYKQCKYDESFKTAEDVELMIQLLKYGEIGNVSEVVYQYRKADTSNGYHNLKQTFFLTLMGRYNGIVKHKYIPTLKGVLMSLAQLIIVAVLPAKWIVRIYESRRFLWLIRERMDRFVSSKSSALESI